MKKIKILIAVFVIITIFLICFIVIINKNSNTNKSESSVLTPEDKIGYTIEPEVTGNAVPPTGGTPYVGNNTLRNITLETEYFNVKSIVDRYFYECKNLKLSDSDITLPRTGLSSNERKDYIKKQKNELQELAQNALLKMLGGNYIKEFGITKTNIANKLEIDDSYKYIIDNILVADGNDRISTFIVNGIIINTTNSKYNNFKIIVVIDASNTTYYIYPQEYLIKHNYINLKEGNKLDLGIEKIDDDIFNKYEIQVYTDELICKELFNNLKTRMIYNTNDLYNLLDSEYTQKRFQNKESFNEYLRENKDVITQMSLKQYAVDNNNYICINNFGNKYKFEKNNEKMSFTIFLDDYTIMSGTELLSYSKMTELQKTRYNLNKFINMINTKDYNAIYSILNSTFRNNNFKTANDLKKYLQNNFYEINKIEVQSIDEKDNYFAFKCNLTNQRNTSETKVVNIIISKTDNTNFTMSFSFEK